MAPADVMSGIAMGMALGGGRKADDVAKVSATSRTAAIESLQLALTRAKKKKKKKKSQKLPAHIEAAAQHGLGLLLVQEGENEEEAGAAECFARAVKLEPSHPVYKRTHEVMTSEDDS